MQPNWRVFVGFVSLLLFATTARAGLAYRFIEAGKNLKSWHRSGSVEVDGDRFRIEYSHDEDGVGAYDLVLSVDNGEHIACVNTVDRTYFEQAKPKVLGKGDSRGKAPSPSNGYEVLLDGVEFRLSKVGPGPAIAGHSTEQFELAGNFQADVLAGKVKLRQLVRIEAHLWVGTDLPRRPLPVDPASLRPNSVRFGSGVEALAVIDRAMTQNLATIDHQVLRLDLKVTRRFKGSRPVEDAVSRQIDSWEDMPIDPTRFELPMALRPQSPTKPAPDPVWR